ncbi:DUF4158 domain-containing protein [Burkholderia sp. JSH-S8]|nr:DUF4158 domain-containing protein [Burkholderia sp. JSH-S8]
MALNERFRRDRRAGAAIQLVFLRASGHTLDRVGPLPRQLLQHVGERLDLPTPSIARRCAHSTTATRLATSIRCVERANTSV